MQDRVVVPAPVDAEGYVELARTKTGRLFRKQILPEGTFVHPGDLSQKIVVDAKLANSLKSNFDAGICDIVQVPIVNDANSHVEDPDRNIGEVVDVSYEKGKGIYVTIDARDKERAGKLGKTLLGASAMMHMDYTDTRTGQKVGPTLLHVAVTNRPYLTNLDDYQEIISASADMSDEQKPVILQFANEPAPAAPVVEPTVEEVSMTLDELIQKLKDDHGVDVPALQTKAASADQSDKLVSALSNVLVTATGQKVEPKNETVSIDEVGAAVVELAAEKVTLAQEVANQKAEIDALKLTAATAEVESLVRAGRILPHQQEVMVKLSVNDRPTFDALVPEKAIVSLSEDGVTVHEKPANAVDSEAPTEEALKAIEKYQTLALSYQDSKNTKK